MVLPWLPREGNKEEKEEAKKDKTINLLCDNYTNIFFYKLSLVSIETVTCNYSDM